MNCQECRDFLDAYLDNELDAATSIHVQQHLRGCLECQEALKSRRALQTLLRRDELRYAPPSELRDRVTRTLTSPDRAIVTTDTVPQRTPRILPLFVPLAIAAALALLAGLAWMNLGGLLRPAEDEPLVAELTSNHIRSLLAGHLLDVPSSDQHTVKPWFAGKIQYAPPVKDVAAAGFKLVGGRLEYINHQDVAALVYQYNKHIINLFVWPVTGKEGSGESTFTRDGFHLVSWQKDGMTYWAVTDAGADVLQRFYEAIGG